MTSEITLFVNPTAGRGRGAHAAQPAARVLREAGFSVRTVLGEDADDALRRAREAVGGDGMMSLALQAVAGTRTPLGVVAVGTGNDFARALGLPVREPAAAGRLVAEALKGEQIREVDLGRVGQKWFGTILASGFDSRVNDRGNRMRWPSGRFKYDHAPGGRSHRVCRRRTDGNAAADRPVRSGRRAGARSGGGPSDRPVIAR